MQPSLSPASGTRDLRFSLQTDFRLTFKIRYARAPWGSVHKEDPGQPSAGCNDMRVWSPSARTTPTPAEPSHARLDPNGAIVTGGRREHPSAEPEEEQFDAETGAARAEVRAHDKPRSPQGKLPRAK